MAIKKIACCVDFSDHAAQAFEQALEIAERFQAKLYLVHVLPPVVNPVLSDLELDWPTEPKKSLILKIEEKMAREYGAKINPKVTSRIVVMDGHVSSEIITFLEEKDIDLVIVGSYGASGMGLVVFGSVANRIARKAPCSVMIVR
ncbi:MAG: universal stress protein [Deltaproteobacteria bacterium]|nr:universal stress protein [Deltaproteobacteria bacterium]MBW2017773.1 universal stress protein [Deltaproteobacteria bacterium]MBW2129829.1 universal stress protein [Deltaproteobacteria bacterium]MBW2305007.1 universal stress protein [Deltaproteobacteria bacterium]